MAEFREMKVTWVKDRLLRAPARFCPGVGDFPAQPLTVGQVGVAVPPPCEPEKDEAQRDTALELCGPLTSAWTRKHEPFHSAELTSPKKRSLDWGGGAATPTLQNYIKSCSGSGKRYQPPGFWGGVLAEPQTPSLHSVSGDGASGCNESPISHGS